MQGLLHQGLALTFFLSQNVPKPVGRKVGVVEWKGLRVEASAAFPSDS